MTARSHTRTMHKQKKRRAVAYLRWRLRTTPVNGFGHRNNGNHRLLQRRQERMDMMEKGLRYTDDY